VQLDECNAEISLSFEIGKTMNMIARVQHRCARANLAFAALVAILQRSPVLRIVAAVDDCVSSSPVGTMLKSAAVAAASLGAVDSMAGATLLATTLTPDPTGPLPTFYATVGVPITPLGFTIANLIAIGSWKEMGDLPPGLILTTVQPNGGTLTETGNLDATTATNPLTTPLLEGTPTVAGTWSINLQGFWKGGESGGPYGGKGISAVFPFTIVVAGTAPVFTTQPISATVAGGTVALDALATQTTSYQWMLNGSPVAGATDSILVVGDAVAGAGTYTCVATNSIGSTTSNPAMVSVTPTGNIGRLVNISTRCVAGTGDNTLIAGFVVGGAGTTGSEPLLIRGSGPALVPFGVTGTLPDPALSLYATNSAGASVLAGTNTGWNGSTAISNTANAVGAFSWQVPTSNDAALLETLPGGPYTAQISGKSGDIGVALAEIYDATPAGTYTSASPRIINISARAQVGTGDNILIVGFAIGGSTSRTVLIRVSGPALIPFGLSATIEFPLLQLVSGSTVLESNSGWGGSKEISAAAAAAGAFTWTDPTSNDAAVLVTLPPGPYTVEVSGTNGGGGTTLVEVYEVP
jgi:hypothetical protein